MNQFIHKIDSISEKYVEVSREISKRPELGKQEFFAMVQLTALLEDEGFKVTKGAAGYETAFIAEIGSGRPAIAFLAEYDALPGLGHACGHNIIGTLAVLAAVGAASELDKTGGKILVYGTPAEEGIEGGCSKAAFVEQGLFDEVDAALMIHPGDVNKLTLPTLANKSYSFEFFGKASHAAAAPEEGRNALDAMIMLFNAVGLMRQQTTTDTRIHGIITHGGQAANIIPDYTKAEFKARGNTREKAAATLERLIKAAEGAALATGCTYRATKFCNDYDDTIITKALDGLYEEAGKEFGVNIDHETEKTFGSTDAGNVSYKIPLIQPLLKVSETPCPIHTKEFAKACVTDYAADAMIKGAKTLASVAIKLLSDEEALRKVKMSHELALEKQGL